MCLHAIPVTELSWTAPFTLRLDNVERRVDSTEKFVDVVRLSDERQTLQLTTISDTLKALIDHGAPNENARSFRGYVPGGVRGQTRTN